jgi:hypothetical protein
VKQKQGIEVTSHLVEDEMIAKQLEDLLSPATTAQEN